MMQQLKVTELFSFFTHETKPESLTCHGCSAICTYSFTPLPLDLLLIEEIIYYFKSCSSSCISL
jgi:hypothetical protein